MNHDCFSDALGVLGLALSGEQIDRFDAFEQALYHANAVMNLTRVPQEESWLRHFVDSLLFQDLIPVGSSVLDIGTGPGFPAWPLACARPDLRVTGLDSNGKMLGFLSTQGLPNLEIVMARAEEWGVRDRFDVVTGRAVAPLAVQLEISAPCAKIGGLVIPMRTPVERESIEAFLASKIGLRLRETTERELPGTAIVRLFAVFEKVDPTPDVYPRPWAEIKRSSLT
ncbi:MAG: 16S rRNA (guanine(527)-N(7))-methyltransferase RsmG [Chlorobia bacterium]|nr:16S rRNA (guanine(527)-N(7))-methyltransferase RsmG [Fimbriimonadaceae bacterium]